jgi:hypothetical protein
MDETIAQYRNIFIIIFALGSALVAGGRISRRLFGLFFGMALASAIVSVCILFNVTALWWLPPDKQKLPDYDVPKLLDSVVRPLEQAAEYQRQAQAALVAVWYLSYYVLLTVGATAACGLMMIWFQLQFRRDVRVVREFIRNNPEITRAG